MGTAIATVKIMPTSPEVDLKKIEEDAKKVIEEFAGKGETRASTEPVAFGLSSLSIIFVMDESLDSPDIVANKIQEFEEVNSAEITDFRRALG